MFNKFNKYYFIQKNINRRSKTNNTTRGKPSQVNDFVNVKILDSNIRLVKNKVTYINHVYQSKYKNNVNSSGLGDFIRGSYFILEFCNLYNFKPNIIFNNSVSLYLKNNTLNIENNCDNIENQFKNISFFQSLNWDDLRVNNNKIIEKPITNNRVKYINKFTQYLNSCNVNNNNVYTYCIAYPFDTESENSKLYMRKILEPTTEMSLLVDSVLSKLALIKKTYTVIHIRSGDNYLNKTTDKFKLNYVNSLFNRININPNNKYLLISDNNYIKKYFLLKYPNIRAFFKEITHIGEGVVLNEDNVKNTMLDFFLLSFAKAIYSYSVYKHGSGFSYWCAKTYNIPYICTYVGE